MVHWQQGQGHMGYTLCHGQSLSNQWQSKNTRSTIGRSPMLTTRIWHPTHVLERLWKLWVGGGRRSTDPLPFPSAWWATWYFTEDQFLRDESHKEGRHWQGLCGHDLDNAVMARWIRFSLWVWGGCVNPHSVPEPQAAESKGPWWKALATTTSYCSWHLQSVACTMFTLSRTKLANPSVITYSDLTVTLCKRVKKSDYQFHLVITKNFVISIRYHFNQVLWVVSQFHLSPKILE